MEQHEGEMEEIGSREKDRMATLYLLVLPDLALQDTHAHTIVGNNKIGKWKVHSLDLKTED